MSCCFQFYVAKTKIGLYKMRNQSFKNIKIKLVQIEKMLTDIKS